VKLKKILSILVIICILALTAACGSKGNTNGEILTAASEAEVLTVPERTPDLMGRVVEIIGNEVTIYRIEGDFAQRVPGGGGQRLGNTVENQNNSEQSSQETPGQSTETRMPRITVSEEKEAIIIPVGTPIVTMQRGSTQATPVGLTEIKKDQILRVWKDEEMVEFVQLMAVSGGRNSAGAGGRQNPGQGGFPGIMVFPGGTGGGPR